MTNKGIIDYNLNMAQQDIIAGLKKCVFFNSLSDEYIHSLSKITKVKEYRKREIIFREKDPADSVFIVFEGIVKIFKISEDGKEHIIHIFGEGEMFAEIALAQNQVYPAWAEALTNAKLGVINRKDLLNLIKEDPSLALSIIGICTIRLKNLVSLIENIRMRDARKRVLCFLWELTNNGKKDEIVLPINKSHISLLLGITPETFSRVLKNLKNENIVLKSIGNRKLKLNLEKVKSEIEL